jgi:hypothetical protein
MFNRSRAMLATVIISALAFGAPAVSALERIGTVITTSKKQRRGLFNGAVLPSSPALRGTSSMRITVAQMKRNSAARRNQQRHKRHVKG